MRKHSRLEPLLAVSIMLIVALIACKNSGYLPSNNRFIQIKEVKIERVFGGIPSESVAYKLYIDTEIKQAGTFSFNKLHWGNHILTLYEIRDQELIKKVDFERSYEKGAKLVLFASMSNIKADQTPETLWKTDEEKEIMPLILDFMSPKSKPYKVKISHIDTLQNYYAK